MTATSPKLEEIIANPDLIISLATQLKKEREEKAKIELQNQQLVADNEYKRDVITGLIDDIPLADMRQRITQIIQKDGVSNIRDKWHTLYAEFDKKYHIKLSTRMNNALYTGTKMDFIEKELRMIPEMYDLTCKLFESSYNKLMEDWGRFAKRSSRYN